MTSRVWGGRFEFGDFEKVLWKSCSRSPYHQARGRKRDSFEWYLQWHSWFGELGRSVFKHGLGAGSRDGSEI